MNFFNSLHRLLRIVYIKAYKNHKFVWGLTIFATLIALSQVPNIKFLVMMSDLLDKDFVTYEQYNSLNNDFTEENQVSVFIGSKDGELTQEQHCLIIHWLNKVHIKQYRIAKVLSTYGYKEVVEGDHTFKMQPILIPDCHQKLSMEEIQEQIHKVSQTPSGHVLTNKDKNDVFASFYLRNLDKDESNRFGHFDTSAFETLRASFHEYVLSKDQGIQVSWVGIGTYQYYLQKAYEQMNLLNLFTGLILILSFKFFFRRWKAGLLLLSTYSFATIFLYGFMGWMNYPVDSLSAAVPIMLLISTLEDFVFFLMIYNETKSIHTSFTKILIPSFYTSLTTCIGFMSLTLSELSIIRRFGLTCAFGAIVEWMIVFLVLPKILSLYKKKYKELDIVSINKKLNHLATKCSRFKLPRIVGILCLLPFTYFFLNYDKELLVNDSPEAVFPKNHPVPVATNKLLKERGWKSEVSLVFNGDVEPLDQTELANQIKERIPEFIASESFYDIKNHLTKNLKYDSSKSYLDRNLKYSDFSQRWISDVANFERVLLYSNTTDVVRVNEMRNIVNEVCKGSCYIANILVSYSEFGMKVLKTLTKSFSLSLLTIVVLLFLLCLHFKVNYKFFTILTALWGPLTLMFVFLFFDIGIYFATSVVMAVLVGLAGDNALQFIFAKTKGQNLDTGINYLGVASFLSMLLMIITSSSFLFSDFEGVRKIGLMMMAGFTMGWIGDLVILRSLIQKS